MDITNPEAYREVQFIHKIGDFLKERGLNMVDLAPNVVLLRNSTGKLCFYFLKDARAGDSNEDISLGNTWRAVLMDRQGPTSVHVVNGDGKLSVDLGDSKEYSLVENGKPLAAKILELNRKVKWLGRLKRGSDTADLFVLDFKGKGADRIRAIGYVMQTSSKDGVPVGIPLGQQIARE